MFFPCVSSAFSGKAKNSPDPGLNLHISYHTAEPYDVLCFLIPYPVLFMKDWPKKSTPEFQPLVLVHAPLLAVVYVIVMVLIYLIGFSLSV